jgi:hypothetical protein
LRPARLSAGGGRHTTTQPHWEPFVEPWRTTVRRAGLLALAIGVGVGLYARQLATVPLVTLIALWFTLGGHFLEVLLRNQLRQRISGQAAVQALVRIACWFAGGSVLYEGALATRAILTGRGAVPWPWWMGGIAFVGIELLVHLLLYVRGQPSFYDGRG